MTDYNVGSQLDADARPRVVHPVVGVEHNSQTERIYHSYKRSLRLELNICVCVCVWRMSFFEALRT